MKYGSVCSGIEAATVAWHPLGWEPQFFSEIEAFPSAVLAHHYNSNMPGKPLGNGIPNHGDMLNFQDWPDHAIELLVGGTPCQDFSVAGLRAGLAAPRGNLTLTYLGVVARYEPRWVVWENVPGVLSVDGGRAFGAFLGGLAELGYGFAYRVLDAQFVRASGLAYAVPQRRRRVFVVGYLGDWRRAAAVLFDGASLRGDSPPRREAGQGVAPTISARTKRGGGLGTDFVSGTLDTTRPGRGGGQAVMAPIAFHGTQDPDVSGDVTHPLGRNYGYEASFQLGWKVRRLTPIECHRLQGFPDDYLGQVIHRGKPPADGPQYKALGNSMAVNVMRVIGERIAMVDALAGD